MQHRSTLSSSRRTFLRGCGLTLAGFGVTSLFPGPFVRHALAQSGPSDRRLLFLFLRGANDGINAVIPHGDPDYNTTYRPTLYVPPTDAIDLGNGFMSLHPALGDLMDVFNAGDLALLHRIGYPNNSRSHFDGQRIWENGDPAQAQLFEGWLYRYIVENAVSEGADLPAITVQSTPPLALRGDQSFVNIANPDTFDYLDTDPLRSKYANAWRRLHADLEGLERYRSILSQTGVKLADTLDEYHAWDQANWNPTAPDTGWHLFPVSDDTNPDDPSGPNGKKFPTGSYGFFRSLKICALSLLESTGAATNGTRIAGSQIGGWDTHENQGTLTGTQATLLSYIGYGIRSLRIALSGVATNEPRGYPSIWANTTVVTMSEFGRTTAENGSLGTDHAAASCQFVAGGNVNGGIYNGDASTWPSGVMFGVEGRYLLERTDYRAVFWEILRDHMGADPATVDAVFPGYTALGLPTQELGLITA
jgi:uncharacterized protein (DUF1501 family)